jgi:hypothetical protein
VAGSGFSGLSAGRSAARTRLGRSTAWQELAQLDAAPHSMIAKGFTPRNGAKVFAIMKHPWVHHDRERFNTPESSEPFAIMKSTAARLNSRGARAAANDPQTR